MYDGDEVEDVQQQQADAQVAVQLEPREEQREQRDATAREAHHRGEPRALCRGEDVRVGSQDDPRQAQRDEGVEGDVADVAKDGEVSLVSLVSLVSFCVSLF